MSKIYISYSRKDEAFVRDLHAKLEANGLETWVDWRDILAGYPWREALFEGLASCDSILICLSRHYAESEMCRMETFISRAYGKRLIPLVLDDCFDLLLEHDELRGLIELQAIPYASKRIIGLELSDDELFQMTLETAKGLYKPLRENLFYFAYPASAAAFATKIAKDLQTAAISTWIGTQDHNIGYDWQQEQWAAMMKARAFILVLNEKAALSDHIRRQVLFAHTRKLPMLPIIAPETDFAVMQERFADSWEMRLISEIQWLQAEPNYESMLEALKGLAGRVLENKKL
jgi:hypothetical protein